MTQLDGAGGGLDRPGGGLKVSRASPGGRLGPRGGPAALGGVVRVEGAGGFAGRWMEPLDADIGLTVVCA